MSEAQRISLPSELDIRVVAEVKEGLQAALDAACDVEVSAEDLTRVDAAGLELLWCFRREVLSNGQSVQWKDVPEAFVAAARNTGLSEALGLEEA